MTKIQNLEEFKQIIDAEFGFIVVSDGTSNVLHQNACDILSNDGFSGLEETTYNWFATLALAEKSFNVTICNICKPE